MSDQDGVESGGEPLQVPADAHSPVEHIDHAGVDWAVPPKRKGGRKPIYTTTQERKQRNRQAQAAFRERRTEYIKKLELSAKETEDTIETFRQNNRQLTDECHMLRYKVSLLEELLNENNIDFRPQLQTRSNRMLLGQQNHSHMVNRKHDPSQAPGAGQPSRRHPLKTSRLSLDSQHSPVPSPSSFTFPALSPGAQAFDVSTDPAPARRRIGPADPHLGHHLSLSSIQTYSGQMTFSAGDLSDAGFDRTHHGNHKYAGSYDLSLEPVRGSQARHHSHDLGK